MPTPLLVSLRPQATQIPAAELKRALQSLSLVKGKNVLRKEPASKEVADSDVFHFNDRFTSKLFKVKIGTVTAQREGEVEKQETRHKVRGGRWQLRYVCEPQRLVGAPGVQSPAPVQRTQHACPLLGLLPA